MTMDRWLEDRFGREVMRPGLERVRHCITSLAIPEPSSSILVVGTNGKGTVATALAAFLQAAGERTALFASPHLLTVRERLHIDGCELDEASWRQAAQAVANFDLSYFEAVYCIARLLAADCDVAVWEAGLGGRYDAVNVAENVEMIVLTGIGHDHLDLLGGSLERILAEKLAVVRRNVPVVVGELSPVLVDKAQGMIRGSKGYCLLASDPLPQRWDTVANTIRQGNPVLARHGPTLAWAMQSLDRLPPEQIPPLPAPPCRWQAFGQLITDVGHNREAATFAAGNLLQDGVPTTVTLALRTRKEAPEIIRELLAANKLVTAWDLPDLGGEFHPPQRLADLLREHHSSGKIVIHDLSSDFLKTIATDRRRLIFGSFVLAGKVLSALKTHEAV